MMIGRRELLRRAGKVGLVALAAPSALTACGESEPTCTQATPAEQAAREGAHYVDHTTSGSRNCLSCQFYTSRPPHSCGPCSLGLGAVSPEGVCDRFATRA